MAASSGGRPESAAELASSASPAAKPPGAMARPPVASPDFFALTLQPYRLNPKREGQVHFPFMCDLTSQPATAGSDKSQTDLNAEDDDSTNASRPTLGFECGRPSSINTSGSTLGLECGSPSSINASGSTLRFECGNLGSIAPYQPNASPVIHVRGNSKEDVDEDDMSEGEGGGRKPRWAISKHAKIILEKIYQMERFPSADMRRRLAADFSVEPRQVQFWYQNRRQRDSRALKAVQASASGPESPGSSHAEVILQQLAAAAQTRRTLGIHQQPGSGNPASVFCAHSLRGFIHAGDGTSGNGCGFAAMEVNHAHSTIPSQACWRLPQKPNANTPFS